MKEIEFLTLADILIIHKNQIELYGGEDGIRDISLLLSALAMPKSTFDSNYLHSDILHMAVAYIYHICKNHPFIDGNKRVALVAGLLFLELNGIEINDPDEELYTMVMNIANGIGDKNYIYNILNKLSRG